MYSVVNDVASKLVNASAAELADVVHSARRAMVSMAHSQDTFGAIKGQESCKRALIVAAVQGHSVAFYGPHGHGKSMLVAAGHSVGVPAKEGLPCPCGEFTNPAVACKCTSAQITRHLKKLSANLGTCDIHCEVPPVPAREMLSRHAGTNTQKAKAQIAGVGDLPSKDSRDEFAEQILKQAISGLGLSAQAVDTVLSVAQSIAALDNSGTIRAEHICEAIMYRLLDRILRG